MDNYFAGTSGLVLPVPNKTYYPVQFKDKSRIAYYGSLFNSIEINSSFYKIPQSKIIAKWAESVPDNFRFTFKLWQGITHEKELLYNPADLDRFIQAINAAGNCKGCFLIQFPPGVRINLLPQLQELIGRIREADPDQIWQPALEFRHPSWYTEHIQQFAEENLLTIVIQDIPSSATPFYYAAGNTVYLRFHGPGGKYSGSYSAEVLQEYSTYIREWREEGKTVYAYFNNTMGDAVQNLATLNALVEQA
ncbi:DUF72 domain-containing protein [Mucilaginibacter sp. SJ]|uniref:DUF72 domain-containing protein n=1 Tax=Mucilaginibacter sp. SJ TaxID=3029053 RepID=UPI0023A9A9B1|nr:DUF72 domain-containing protein [Mucilaginibacter sp. SJ]WEA01654.1 DUF72 domain-containing protein [Mucilaginibacter sp. SJ]